MAAWRRAERLRPTYDVRESDLQRIFDGWGRGTGGVAIAGAPDWLWEAGAPVPQATYRGFGYEFTPDVLWRTRRKNIVAELKYAAKNEPLAVAEVLQHANMLRRIEQGRAVTPVVISQLSGWIRAAVNELARSALRHVEVDLLQAGRRRFCWLSDPHAAPRKLSRPPNLPLDADWHRRTWWKVENEPTWIVSEARPELFPVGPFAVVSRVRSAPDFILWKGQMPALGEVWTKREWDAAGEFWVFDAKARSGTVPPPPPLT